MSSQLFNVDIQLCLLKHHIPLWIYTLSKRSGRQTELEQLGWKEDKYKFNIYINITQMSDGISILSKHSYSKQQSMSVDYSLFKTSYDRKVKYHYRL